MSSSNDAVLVLVRAFNRPTFTGYRRGGHFWPSAMPGRFAYVTPALYAVLKAEKALATSIEPSAPEDVPEEVLDLPAKPDIDHVGQAIDRAAALKRENDGLVAMKKAAALEAENAALRAELAEALAAKAPPRAAAPMRPASTAHDESKARSKGGDKPQG